MAIVFEVYLKNYLNERAKVSYTIITIVTEIAAVHFFHKTGNVRCTVTGQRYASLLELSVIPALKKGDVINVQFLCRMVLRHIPPFE